jgi:hypothetical protein
MSNEPSALAGRQSLLQQKPRQRYGCACTCDNAWQNGARCSQGALCLYIADTHVKLTHYRCDTQTLIMHALPLHQLCMIASAVHEQVSKHAPAVQAAEEHEAAEAATDLVIRLGLAAFAVSAYIKTVLCPSMSSYTPRMSSASLVRHPA